MNNALQHLYREELYNIKAGVVVVLAREWHTLPEEEQALLNKILGSVKLNPARVHIVCKPALSLSSLKHLAPNKVLVFGSKLEEDFKSYENITTPGVSIIRADDLNQLDDQRKKNLWLALRQMFGV